MSDDKKSETVSVTVRLSPKVHEFLSAYTKERGLSLGSFFSRYAYRIYEQEQDKAVEREFKRAHILEVKCKMKNLSSNATNKATSAQARDKT